MKKVFLAIFLLSLVFSSAQASVFDATLETASQTWQSASQLGDRVAKWGAETVSSTWQATKEITSSVTQTVSDFSSKTWQSANQLGKEISKSAVEFIFAPFAPGKEIVMPKTLSIEDLAKIEKSLQENQNQLNLTNQELQDLKNQFSSFKQQPVTVKEITQEIQKIIQPEKVVQITKEIEKQIEVVPANTLVNLQAQLSSLGIRLTATENRLALTPAPQIIYTPTATTIISSAGNFTADKLFVSTEAFIAKLNVTKDATISGNLAVSGSTSLTSLSASADAAISGNLTLTGRGIFNKAPTLAHTFVSWAPGAANSKVEDSAIYINPASATADTNLLGLAVAGSPKFIVDAEGDVFVNNLTAAGSTNVGASTISTLTVENNTTLGDANTDLLTIFPGTLTFSGVSSSRTFDFGPSTSATTLTVTNSGTGIANLSVEGAINGLTLAAAADGFSVAGGTTSRTLSVTGSNITLTGTAVTNVTLPTTGTLATLAGVETLTGKTISAASNTLTGVARTDAANTFGAFNQTFDTNTLFVDATNDRVGIGTTGPVAKLQIQGPEGNPATSGTTVTGHLALGGSSNNNMLTFGTQSASPFAAWMQTTDDTNLATTYPLLLNPNGGNVGIGTTGPQNVLHVHKTTSADTFVQMTNSDTGATSSDGFLVGVQAGGVPIVWNRENSALQIATNNTERIKIAADGNVGIGDGVTSPSAQAHIIQTDAADAFRVDDQASDTTPFVIDQSGNVGIGTTGPQNVLHVHKTTSADTFVQMTNSDTGATSSDGFLVGVQAGGVPIVWNRENSALQIATNNTERIKIAADGNVGIGTGAAGPLLKLDVAGSGRFTGAATSVLTGSIDATASTAVVGVGTFFTTELVVGDRITVTGETRTVTAITDNTNLTVDTAFTDTANDTSPDKLPAILIARDSSNAMKLVVNDQGNVGIGTTGPIANSSLNIVRGAHYNVVLERTDTTNFLTFAVGSTLQGFGSNNGFGFFDASYANRSTTGAGWAELMRITNSGNVGINQTNPTAMTTTGATLEIVGGICVKNATACPTGLTAGAIRFDTDSVVFDIAESYSSLEPLSPGDLVKIKSQIPNNSNFQVEKTTQPYEKTIIGIVSTHAAMAIKDSEVILGPNPSEENSLQPLIALAGRVPVKVSLENGEIKIGDRITSSSTPGVGMKATQSGNTIGIALENFDISVNQQTSASISGFAEGKIMVFINLGYSRLDDAILGGPTSQNSVNVQEVGPPNNWFVEQTTGRIKTSLLGDFDLENRALYNIRGIFSTNWSIDESGKLAVQEIETEKLTVGKSEKPTGVTLYDKVTGLPYCLSIESGVTISKPGKCEEQTTPTPSETLPILPPTPSEEQNQESSISQPNQDDLGEIGATSPEVTEPIPEEPTLSENSTPSIE